MRLDIWKAFVEKSRDIRKYSKSEREILTLRPQRSFRSSYQIIVHLIRVHDDLALFLVAPGDEQHVVQRWCVIQDALVLERREHVACSELDEVDAALVDRQPQGFWPIRSERLLKQRIPLEECSDDFLESHFLI